MKDFESFKKKHIDIFTPDYAPQDEYGAGSSPENCEPWYKEVLPKFLKEYNIKSVIDLGCGDWRHLRLVDWTGIDYTGMDIVEFHVKRNNEQPNRSCW